MPRLFFGSLAALSLLLTSACAVIETTAGVAGAAVSTAASVTGTVVETTVDAVTYPVRD